MVLGSGGGDGHGGGRVFSRGKGVHAVVGDASPRQGYEIRAVWAWTIFMLNSFGTISPFLSSLPLPLLLEFLFARRCIRSCLQSDFIRVLSLPLSLLLPLSPRMPSYLHLVKANIFTFRSGSNSVYTTGENRSCCRNLRAIIINRLE